MTDKKEMTEEEIREKLRVHSRKTLENKLFQNVLGSNTIKSNLYLFGQIGKTAGDSAYSDSLNSPEAGEIRKNLYAQRKEQGDRMGIYGEPSIGNYEVSELIMRQIQESELVLSLGDFGDIVKGIADGFKFDVPKQLKNYVPMELVKKVEEAAELNEEEKYALKTYELLSQTYKRAASVNVVKGNYFSDLNYLAEQISEKYKQEEKKEVKREEKKAEMGDKKNAINKLSTP